MRLVLLIAILVGSMLNPAVSLDLGIKLDKIAPPLQQGDPSKRVPEVIDSKAFRDPRREQQGDPSPKVPPVEGPPISGGGSRPPQLLQK